MYDGRMETRGRAWGEQSETIAIFQERDDGGLVRCDRNGEGMKWSESQDILKIEMRFC